MKIFVKYFALRFFSTILSNISCFFYPYKSKAKRNILCTMPEVGLDSVSGMVPPFSYYERQQQMQIVPEIWLDSRPQYINMPNTGKIAIHKDTW